MAKLLGVMQMTGTLGGMSVYKMKGCDELIIRTKGGATKEQIKTLDCFRNMRKQGDEWSGVGKMAGAIRRSMIYLSSHSDYNYSGQLSAKAKAVQKLDTVGEYGKRSVLLSLHRSELSGFSLNKKCYFSSVVRIPITWQIDRDTLSARVNTDAFRPAVSLLNEGEYPFFRFTVVLGCVSDMVYDEAKKEYRPANENHHEKRTAHITDWFHVQKEMPAKNLSLSLNDKQIPPDEHDTLILGIGIEFGTTGVTGKPEASKNSGCAMILGLE